VTDDLSDWFTDDPHGDEARRLGRGPFVKVVIESIAACKKRESSTVLSLVGPWGSGKSSIIDAIISGLGNEAAGWTVVTFNPWMYQDLESLQSGFFSELAAAFPDESKGAKARARIADFAEAVAPLTTIGAVVGVDVSESLSGLSKLIRGKTSAAAAHDRLTKTLMATAAPVLVIMDDLDRLSPDELLLTFKLVRLIGRLPHVHYLLAYDEDTLLDALSRTGLVGDSRPRARDYLEKVVQARFDIPSLRPADIRSMTDELLNKALSAVNADLTPEQSRRFSQAYFGHLERRLTTPRALFRYFAQVRLSLASVPGELDLSDFLVITWLRTNEPGAYRLIQNRRALVLGTSPNKIGKTDDERIRISNELRDALIDSGTRVEELDDVAELIGGLFPSFKQAWDGKSSGRPRDRRQRAFNSFYFDRFFALGVPEGDIPDSIVAAAVSSIASGQADEAFEPVLAASFTTSTELTLEKIAYAAESYRKAPIVLWLASHISKVPDVRSLLPPRQRVAGIAARLMREVSEGEIVQLFRDSISSESALAFVMDVTADATTRRDDDPPEQVRVALSEATRTALGELIESTYLAARNDDPFEMPPMTWHAIWNWSILDLDSLRRWIGTKMGEWGPLDLSARFVGTSSLSTGGETRLSAIDFDLLERVLDLPALLETLKHDLDQIISNNTGEKLLETKENRRAEALRQLKVRREALRESLSGS
jgi:hypothetical protein